MRYLLSRKGGVLFQFVNTWKKRRDIAPNAGVFHLNYPWRPSKL